MFQSISPGSKLFLIIFVLSLLVLLASPALPQIEDVQMLLDKTHYSPKEKILLAFTAPEGIPAGARIALVPSELPHEEDAADSGGNVAAKTIASQFLNGMTSGTLIFTAPEKPGKYDFRMYEVIPDLYETGSMSFFVVAP